MNNIVLFSNIYNCLLAVVINFPEIKGYYLFKQFANNE